MARTPTPNRFTLSLVMTAFLLNAAFLIGESDEQRLFPVKVNGLVGYIDRSGAVIIKLQYVDGGPFSDGLAQVKKGKKWGFINTKGNFAIEAQFDGCSPFSAGLARVFLNGSGFGFVDRTGRIVIPIKYNILDEKFSDGRVRVNSGDLWGYIDRNGRLIIPCQYDIATPFAEGIAFVAKGSDRYLIDVNGKVLAKLQFDMIGRFSEELSLFRNADGRFGYVDMNGKIAIAARFSFASPIQDGLAAVGVPEPGKDPTLSLSCGFIGKDGSFVIGPKYSRARSFYEGWAAVKDSKGWTYVNKRGQAISSERFDFAQDFNSGLALVGRGSDDLLGRNGKQPSWGYIDETGKHVWEPSQ